jgi:hypothetical protein
MGPRSGGRAAVEEFFQLSNCPTQAKTRLEWATGI